MIDLDANHRTPGPASSLACKWALYSIHGCHLTLPLVLMELVETMLISLMERISEGAVDVRGHGWAVAVVRSRGVFAARAKRGQSAVTGYRLRLVAAMDAFRRCGATAWRGESLVPPEECDPRAEMHVPCRPVHRQQVRAERPCHRILTAARARHPCQPQPCPLEPDSVPRRHVQQCVGW